MSGPCSLFKLHAERAERICRVRHARSSWRLHGHELQGSEDVSRWFLGSPGRNFLRSSGWTFRGYSLVRKCEHVVYRLVCDYLRVWLVTMFQWDLVLVSRWYFGHLYPLQRCVIWRYRFRRYASVTILKSMLCLSLFSSSNSQDINKSSFINAYSTRRHVTES